MTLQVAILAGGLGTRVKSISGELPKALISVAGKPFIERQIQLLVDSGYRDLVICVGYRSSSIIEYLGNGSKFGARIEYSNDGPLPLGTKGAIKNALNLLGDNFAVLYGDSYLPIDFSLAEKAYIEGKKNCLMTVYKNENKFDASNIHFQDGTIIKYSKNPSDKQLNYIDYGLLFFCKTIFESDIFPESNDLSSTIEELVKMNQVSGYEVNNRFYEIGSPQGIKDLETYFLGLTE